ncbi:MAG TPA: outer membrane protein transport protein [Polyangia bacterium]|jgi:long-chain fatty acid transport protein
MLPQAASRDPHRRTLAVAGFAFALGLTQAAAAQPLASPWVGGVAFSGPASSDLTSIYYNPAAIGVRRGTSIQLGFAGTLGTASIDRSPIDPATGAPVAAGAAGARAFSGVRESVFTSTGFAALATDLGTDNVTLGIAAYTPFVEHRAPGTPQLSPGQDAPTRYHLIDLTLYHVYLTPTVTIRVADFFFIGLGLDIIFSQLGGLTLDRDTALDGTALCSVARQGVESDLCAERIHTSGSAVSVGVPVGILLRPTERLDIGVSYRSGAFGTSRDDVPLIGSGVLTSSQAAVAAGQPPTQNLFARTSVHLPHTVVAGAQLQLSPRWDLGLTARWIHWAGEEVQDIRLSTAATNETSVPERIPMYRGYRDNLLVRGTAGYRRGPLRLGAGALVQTPSVDASAVSPAVVDGWQLGGALMLEAQLGKHVAVTAGYGLRGVIPRTITTSAFDPLYQLDCVQSRYDIPTCRLANRGRGVPQTAGDYGALLHELGATAVLKF